MYQLLIGLYILVCFLLVVVILMQSGRGGGLVESFSATDTLFGGKTNIYMVRITIVLGSLFLLFALGLNYFVAQKSKSVVDRLFRKSRVKASPALPVPATSKPSVQEKEKATNKDKKPVNNPTKDKERRQAVEQVKAKSAEEAEKSEPAKKDRPASAPVKSSPDKAKKTGEVKPAPGSIPQQVKPQTPDRPREGGK